MFDRLGSIALPDCVQIVPASSPEWNSCLAPAIHDFFHTSQYHQLWQEPGCREACLAIYGTRERFLAWPYIIGEVAPASNLLDISCVYGYAGPVLYRCETDDSFLLSAWNSLLELWRTQHAVSVFTRFHPVLENHRWMERIRSEGSFGPAGVHSHGQTVAIDLSLSEAEIWKHYERKLRQKLRRCSTFGFVSTVDDDWVHLEDFVRLYQQTMRRNKAAPFYFFPRDHFLRLKTALGPHGTMLVTKYGQRVVACAILIEYQGIGHLYLSASDEEFAHFSPSKLMTHDSVIWARQRGVRYFHMGGGRASSNDSLFSFKASFSPYRFSFYTGRWILEAEQYEDLTERRRLEAGGKLAGDYFPSYRAPYGNGVCEPRRGHVGDPVWNSVPALDCTGSLDRIDKQRKEVMGLQTDEPPFRHPLKIQ